MKIAYDLDGVHYNSLNHCLKIDNSIITSPNFGYTPIQKEKYRKHFQTKNWREFYLNLGIGEENLDEIIKLINKEYKKAELLPNLIPGAIEAINLTEKKIGRENLFFITNMTLNEAKKRFERDNLIHLIPNIRTSTESKTEEIYKTAIEQSNIPFVYVGDLVSDGEACLEARIQGASNIQFYGIIHEYAMNLPKDMEKFVNSHQDFAKILNNLSEIERIWNP